MFWADGSLELLEVVSDLDPSRASSDVDMKGRSNLGILVERSTAQKENIGCPLG